MKLYSLLILSKNTKKSKNNFKALKKSEIVIFPGCILPCKQNKSAIYTALFTTYSHVLDSKIKAITANWCLLVRTWGDTPATLIVCPTHHHVAQCCRNIQPSFSKYLDIQKVCLGFKRLHRNVDKKYFFKSKKSEKKNHDLGYTLLHYKTKNENDVIPRSCFNLFINKYSYLFNSMIGEITKRYI